MYCENIIIVSLYQHFAAPCCPVPFPSSDASLPFKSLIEFVGEMALNAKAHVHVSPQHLMI
jgi:hypothetical protein